MMSEDEMIQALADVRDQMIRDQAKSRERTVAADPATPAPVPDERKAIISQVLYSMLVNLDGWIEVAKDNPEGSGHKGESTGSECWNQFAPQDIRTMVNDVAREYGVSEFPLAKEVH